MLIIRCRLIADRRLELHKSLELGRSDKCRSWYIAACIVGGERHDRLVSPPARIVDGEHCSTLASPLAGSSDEELGCTPLSAPAHSRSEAPADIVAVPVGAAPFGKLAAPPDCRTGAALVDSLGVPPVGTLAAAPAGTPPPAPVGTPGGRRGCRLGEVHRSSSRGGSRCNFGLPAVAGRWCTPGGVRIGSLDEVLGGGFASIAVSPLDEAPACTLGGRLGGVLRGTLGVQLAWARTHMLPVELDGARIGTPLFPLGEVWCCKPPWFLHGERSYTLDGAPGGAPVGTPGEAVDEVPWSIPPGLPHGNLAFLVGEELGGECPDISPFPLAAALARAPVGNLDGPRPHIAAEAPAGARGCRLHVGLENSFAFLLDGVHLDIPPGLPGCIPREVHPEGCCSIPVSLLVGTAVWAPVWPPAHTFLQVPAWELAWAPGYIPHGVHHCKPRVPPLWAPAWPLARIGTYKPVDRIREARRDNSASPPA